MQTTVSELVRVKEHEGNIAFEEPSASQQMLTRYAARMYTVLPMVWSIG